MNDTILEMRNITKLFPGVRALDRVNFQVQRGEVHCLVGENGAGKSTLMKVLSGVYPHGSYSGDILFDGEVQAFRNIAASEAKGIVTIYQELALIPELSVYENIYYGHELVNGLSINWNRTVAKAKEMLQLVGLDVDPSTPVKNLGVGKQQLVEIAKALSKDAKLLVFDEPTAALNEEDSKNLLKIMRRLNRQGITCIMISHKLREVTAIADTITVLRDGTTICSLNVHEREITEAEIIRHMVGREITDIYPKRRVKPGGGVVFEVKHWSIGDADTGRRILKDVNFHVRRGEIVGLQGLMGAGRTECAQSIFGNPAGYKLMGGEILLMGKPVHFKTPKQAIDAGVAYVTEDRKGNGLIGLQDVRYNITLAGLKQLEKGLSIDENQEMLVANEYKASIDIKTPSVAQKVSNLSGGNQQKVQIAKWMYTHPALLILDEPTRGIDVGAKSEIYALMHRLAEQGMSIIMISSELPEVLGMSDRIYVMSGGTIVGELDAEDATEDSIMAMAINS